MLQASDRKLIFPNGSKAADPIFLLWQVSYKIIELLQLPLWRFPPSHHYFHLLKWRGMPWHFPCRLGKLYYSSPNLLGQVHICAATVSSMRSRFVPEFIHELDPEIYRTPFGIPTPDIESRSHSHVMQIRSGEIHNQFAHMWTPCLRLIPVVWL